jgi:predicted MFS family arabinose efflux permease
MAGGLGTLVIAFLNGQFGWRATFGLVLILALIGFLMVSRFVKESKAGGSKRVDWTGILLTAAGLFGVVYGINQAAVAGFRSPQVLVPVGIGLVMLILLVLHSRRVENPALQLRLFKNKIFSVVISFASIGPFFQLSNYLQALQKLPPLQASLILLPYTLSIFVFAILAGGWVKKISNRMMIAGGMALMAVGLVTMGFLLSPTAGFWIFLVPMTLLGGGFSIANTPRISAVLASAPPELAGSASATNNASAQLGNSLGIALMGALFGSFARNTYLTELTEKELDQTTIQKSVEILQAWLKDNTGDVAAQFGITLQQMEGVIAEYQNAFTSGVSYVLWIGAAVAVVGMLLAWFSFRKRAA